MVLTFNFLFNLFNLFSILTDEMVYCYEEHQTLSSQKHKTIKIEEWFKNYNRNHF